MSNKTLTEKEYKELAEKAALYDSTREALEWLIKEKIVDEIDPSFKCPDPVRQVIKQMIEEKKS